MADAFTVQDDSNTAVLEVEETAGEASIRKPEHGHDQKFDPHHQCGYGACSISGCYCQSYSGQAYTCANCGHNYASHW